MGGVTMAKTFNVKLSYTIANTSLHALGQPSIKDQMINIYLK